MSKYKVGDWIEADLGYMFGIWQGEVLTVKEKAQVSPLQRFGSVPSDSHLYNVYFGGLSKDVWDHEIIGLTQPTAPAMPSPELIPIEDIMANVPKCECGAHSVKSNNHSPWCPLKA